MSTLKRPYDASEQLHNEHKIRKISDANSNYYTQPQTNNLVQNVQNNLMQPMPQQPQHQIQQPTQPQSQTMPQPINSVSNLNLSQKYPRYHSDPYDLIRLLNFIQKSSTSSGLITIDNLYSNFDKNLINSAMNYKLFYIDHRNVPHLSVENLINNNNSTFDINPAFNAQSLISLSHLNFIHHDINYRLDHYCFNCHELVTKFSFDNVCYSCFRVTCFNKTCCQANTSMLNCHSNSNPNDPSNNNLCCLNLRKSKEMTKLNSTNSSNNLTHLYNKAIQNLLQTSGILHYDLNNIFNKKLPYYSLFITTFIQPKDLLNYTWTNLHEFHFAIRQIVHNVLVYPHAHDGLNQQEKDGIKLNMINLLKAVRYIESNLPLIESCPNCYNHSDYRENCKFHSIVLIKNAYIDPWNNYITWPAIILDRTDENSCTIKFLNWDYVINQMQLNNKLTNNPHFNPSVIQTINVNNIVAYDNNYNTLPDNTKANTDQIIQDYKNREYTTELYIPNKPSNFNTFLPVEYENEIDPEETEMCCVCNTSKGEFSCGNCFERHYCSVNCQTVDWKEHRKHCRVVQDQNKTQNGQSGGAEQQNHAQKSQHNGPKNNCQNQNGIYQNGNTYSNYADSGIGQPNSNEYQNVSSNDNSYSAYHHNENNTNNYTAAYNNANQPNQQPSSQPQYNLDGQYGRQDVNNGYHNGYSNYNNNSGQYDAYTNNNNNSNSNPNYNENQNGNSYHNTNRYSQNYNDANGNYNSNGTIDDNNGNSTNTNSTIKDNYPNHGQIIKHDELSKIHPEILRNQNVDDCEKIECPICNKIYSNKGNLKSHIKVVHKLAQEEIDRLLPNQTTKKVDKSMPDKNKMQCPICKQFYRSRGNLRVHLKGTHKMSLEEAREYLPKNPNRQAKVGEERANCPLCERNYGTKQSLRFHLKTNHPELDTGKIANILSEIQNVKN